MNNLYRKLAPVSDAAWEQIEEEARRTLKRHLAARRVVDVKGPNGVDFSSVGTGHIQSIEPPAEGIQAAQRLLQPLIELRVPFELSRQAIDDVERGSDDSDWSPLKEAARKIAFAEDNAVFDGYAAAGIRGISQASSNPTLTLSANVRSYTDIIAQAISQLRLAGVNGPYRLVLGAAPFTTVNGGSDEGYPVLQHIKQLIEGDIVWAPAIQGGYVLSTRGGDFELSIGQDVSVGYLSHTDSTVKLYLQESFTFRVLTDEASVPLAITVKP